jgi:signal transduction histidine kinase/ActR/RegA family two-component response regulator
MKRPGAVPPAERTLILAPRGRDAVVAMSILGDAELQSAICVDLPELVQELEAGADAAIVTEEATRDRHMRDLVEWVGAQPPWSDPFIVLTMHGGGLERNPSAAQLTSTLGNVTFLERPFHPTTLVSIVQTSLRSRRRQYECRRLNEELETRVVARTAELAVANRELLGQIEERERVEATLRQMQRLEAVGQLTSGVAHDFNNLLTVILGNIGLIEETLTAVRTDPKLAQRLSYMRSAAERGAQLTDQLLSFSRRQRLQPRSLNLNETLSGMRDLMQSTIGGSIAIETRFEPGLWPALADPAQLELAVLNLAINARDAMEVGGRLTVATANVTLGPPRYPEEPAAGDYVEVCVCDTGTGMSEEVRRKVFEPFFTTKEIGKGSGLGLSQVLGFAQQSSGGVRIESHLGEGTAIHLYLPRADCKIDGPAASAPRQSTGRQVGGAKLLLVDDDNAVREVTAAMLTELGYLVLAAGNGAGALEQLERNRAIDLMIVDFAMPGMNGVEVARRARRKRPDLPILFITGFVDHAVLAGIGEAEILGKPFSVADLADKVTAALARARSDNIIRLRR